MLSQALPSAAIAANHDIMPRLSRKVTASTVLQITTGTLGVCAGLIYYAPSLSCAQTESCGKWLTDLTSEKAAHLIFFAAGAGAYGAINAFFSADSIPRTVAYIQKQKNVQAKILKTTGIIGLTLTQTAQIGLACIGTRAGLWPSILTISGSIPGALYGVAGMMDIELPVVADKLTILKQELYYVAVSKFRYLSPEEAFQRQRSSYYQQQRKALLEQARANWKTIVTSARHLDEAVYKNKTPLQLLFSPQAPIVQPLLPEKGIRFVGKLGAGYLVVAFSLPFALNSLHTLENYVPDETIATLVTGFLGLAQFYGNVKIVFHFMDALLDLLKACITGEHFDCLPYQTRPSTTAAATLMAGVVAGFSYVIANLLTTNDYFGPEMDGVRTCAMLGVTLYHFDGLLHLYHLILKRITQDEKEQALFKGEDALTQLDKTLLMDYAKQIENPENQLQQLTHMPVFQAVRKIEVLVNDVEAQKSVQVDEQNKQPYIELPSPTPVKNGKSATTKTGNWMSFHRAPVSAQDRLVEQELLSGKKISL